MCDVLTIEPASASAMRNLQRFVTTWTAHGVYCQDSGSIMGFDLMDGLFICDFVALLIDPRRSAVGQYLHGRANSRLATKREFSMNCWQFVLLYLHDCHGLTFNDMRAMYRHMSADRRVPDFFAGAEPTDRQPGCVVCYTTRNNVVWHTEVVADDNNNIGICAGNGTVAVSNGDAPANDIYYLDPVAVVAAIRRNIILRSANTLSTDIDNIDNEDYEHLVIAIANTDRMVKAAVEFRVAECAANIPYMDVLQGAPGYYMPSWYTPVDRDSATRRMLANIQRASIRTTIVEILIAQCL